MDTLEQRIGILERQVKFLRTRTKETWELLDLLATPPWKRVWFFLCGWRLWRIGRWYGKDE